MTDMDHIDRALRRDGGLARTAAALRDRPLCRVLAFVVGAALCWRAGVPLLLHALAGWPPPSPPSASPGLDANGLARTLAAALAGAIATYAWGCRCVGPVAMGVLLATAMGVLLATAMGATTTAFFGYGAALDLGAIPAPPRFLSIAPATAGAFLVCAVVSAAGTLSVRRLTHAAWREEREQREALR